LISKHQPALAEKLVLTLYQPYIIEGQSLARVWKCFYSSARKRSQIEHYKGEAEDAGSAIFGYVATVEGLYVDPTKVRAIGKMPLSKDVVHLRKRLYLGSQLGLVQP